MFGYMEGRIAIDDWASIKSNPEQLLDNAGQFRWYEKVNNHHTGYGRDGYCVMY